MLPRILDTLEVLRRDCRIWEVLATSSPSHGSNCIDLVRSCDSMRAYLESAIHKPRIPDSVRTNVVQMFTLIYYAGPESFGAKFWYENRHALAKLLALAIVLEASTSLVTNSIDTGRVPLALVAVCDFIYNGCTDAYLASVIEQHEKAISRCPEVGSAYRSVCTATLEKSFSFTNS